MSVLTLPASAVDLKIPSELDRPPGADRRDDIDAKQQRLAQLLAEVDCEGLLVLDQANLAWLSSGGVARSITDVNELPALYFASNQRWLISSNVDSQRMFDEELDGMGFLLKEWPWHWGRDTLLADLVAGRKVAADCPFRDTHYVGDRLRALRRILTPYEQACYRLVGEVVAHALEATCRNAQPGDSERELAGQISHRLYRRGATPAVISVAADGRSQEYRRHGFTSAPVTRHAVLTCTARKYGLYATASRSFTFGEPAEELRRDHLTACKVAATFIASTWPDADPQQMFQAAKRVYHLTGYEHEWQLCPQGFVSGRIPVELNLTPDTKDLLQPGWAMSWGPAVGAAVCCDSFLILDSGPERVTPCEDWPLVTLRISGLEVTVPHLLTR